MEAVPVVITIVITFLSPFVTAYFNRVQWSSETKNLVAILVSAAIAVVYLFMTGGIGDWSQLAVVIPAVYGLQQAIFAYILKIPAKQFEIATTSQASLIAYAEDNPPAPAPAAEPTATIYSDTPAKG